jgi:spermidine synthase
MPSYSSVGAIASKMTSLVALFFLSGTGGLVLQVLWMYQLGLVFGNAAYATAATLSAFFLGLALGGAFWGRISERFRRPLAAYGLLEIAIAAAALLWMPALDFYETRYAVMTALLGDLPGGVVIGKFLFSTSLLLLPTFLMGGTFPVLTHFLVRDQRHLGRRGTALYAFNTLGAALGALLAGFYLLPKLGVQRAYFTAVVLLTAVGIAALILDRLRAPKASRTDDARANREGSASVPDGEESSSPRATGPASAVGGRWIAVLAVASGFLTLAAETLWTRMFAQVLQNSVYSFSAILVVFLIALAIGGLLAHGLARTAWSPRRVVSGLLLSGALLVGLSPMVFEWATGGVAYIAPRASWEGYLAAVFLRVALVVLPPTVIMGAIFPFLLKASPRTEQSTGRIVGRLVLLNSLGAVAGPIIAGFILLEFVGLWITIKIVAMAYGVLALFVSGLREDRVRDDSQRKSHLWNRRRARLTIAAVTLAGVLAIPNPPVVRLEPGETLRAVWQASDGVVSVVEQSGNIQLRLDNFYALGDSRSSLVEQMQAHVPLLIHPDPNNVLFLGLGTGVTAGASLIYPVERVVAAELVPNVARAADLYFSPWANGLFEDTRVEIVTDDARNYLLGSTETFDVIVGDLFTPWHAGTGSLYTVEQFELVREHLEPGGVFAQWLPLYQLTSEGFETIAATFASVFPQVTVWRSDFSESRASIALVGQAAGARLDQAALLRNSRILAGTADTDADADADADHMATLFYVGNLTTAPDRFSGHTLNTDDRRVVELRAPVLAQRANAGHDSFVVGENLARLFRSIRNAVPSTADPYLSAMPDSEIRYAEAGLLYFEYLRLARRGLDAEALEVLDRIAATAPAFAEVAGRSAGEPGEPR